MLRGGEGETGVARNKHPEETIQRILDIAFRLFMEKGYEHTSIQDIIDHLEIHSHNTSLSTGSSASSRHFQLSFRMS